MSRARSPRRARGRRHVAVRVAAIAVLMSVIGATVLTLRPDDGDDADDTEATAVEELEGAAKELVDLLSVDKQATFHAVYEVSSAEFAGAAVSFETWRRPPSVRSDITVTKPDGIVRTRQLVLEGGSMACQQADESPWQCARSPELNDPFQSDIREQVAKADSVTAEDRVIDGRDVRCFTLTRPDATAEFCATEEGVPVLVESGGTSLRLVTLGDEVGDVFEPPAEPV